jgi:hypothetical protein
MNNYKTLIERVKLLETKIEVYSHLGDAVRVNELQVDLMCINEIILELMTLNPELGAA